MQVWFGCCFVLLIVNHSNWITHSILALKYNFWWVHMDESTLFVQWAICCSYNLCDNCNKWSITKGHLIYGPISGSVLGITLRSKDMALLNNNSRSSRWATKVDYSFMEQKDCVMPLLMVLYQPNVKLWNSDPPKVAKMKWMDTYCNNVDPSLKH